MSRIAVFPGSFDPVTRGHEAIVRRALGMFEQVVVAIGQNTGKSYYFPLQLRQEWLSQVFARDAGVSTLVYSGLTVELCRSLGARYILRGLRTAADFEFERTIAQVNRQLAPEIETLFLLSSPEFDALNSSLVREIHRFGGDISAFVPEGLSIPPPTGQ
ncbi:MAG TPA: pantetheine-phosphate adenylyltransferase [Bacteroidales bacterium]|nr:pantetheine-phosphate adenylyltransferase [Bacteroidales bacterium]